MDYQVSRHVINIPDESKTINSEQLEMDFFLAPEQRKVILGTVRYPDGTPAPNSVVKFFRLKYDSGDPDSSSELEPIGHAIADESGQFLLGPVFPGDKIIIKIFYLEWNGTEEYSIPYRSTHKPGSL